MEKLTPDIINERLLIQKSHITMIGEYVNTSTKTLFRCSFGHEWSALPRDVMGRNGCPYCGGKVPLTKDMVNDRLLKNRSNIVLVDGHVRRHTKALFRCQNNHEWQHLEMFFVDTGVLYVRPTDLIQINQPSFIFSTLELMSNMESPMISSEDYPHIRDRDNTRLS